ncbi:hypothetical protein NLG97_g5904 [Lecanicillium saksenae]|uniref:Uncharacterized protein n=1 Tax=Lecanicillium saksenae TaxID=468837 RepID=A0ACC1QSI7_9HYPO|nr:hypothetical protein NLG97_g5904 [Lecanicillium saksenae]
MFSSLLFTCFQEGVNYIRHFGIFSQAYLEILPYQANATTHNKLCFSFISWLGEVLTPAVADRQLNRGPPFDLSRYGTIGSCLQFKLQTLELLIHHCNGGYEFDEAMEKLWAHFKQTRELWNLIDKRHQHTLWLFLSLLFSLPSTAIVHDDWQTIKSLCSTLPLPDCEDPAWLSGRADMVLRVIHINEDLQSPAPQFSPGLRPGYVDLVAEAKYNEFCETYFLIMYSTEVGRQLERVGQMDLIKMVTDTILLSQSLPREYRVQTFRREFILLDLLKSLSDMQRYVHINTKWEQWREAAITFTTICPVAEQIEMWHV